VIEAIGGMRYNAIRNELTLINARGRSGSSLPLVTATGWGAITQRDSDGGLAITLATAYGSMAIERIVIEDSGGDMAQATTGDAILATTIERSGNRLAITLPAGTSIAADQTLTLRIAR
jgi:hypothetical protein